MIASPVHGPIRVPTLIWLSMFILALAACRQAGQDEAAADTKPRVTLRTLALQDWNDEVTIPATAIPNNTVNVVAKVPGRVLSIPADEGTEVLAGDTLVELDPRDLIIALKAAEGQVAMARAGLEAARVQRDNLLRDKERFDALRRTGSIPAADADKVDAGLRAAEAQVGMAEAQLNVASTGLEMSRRNRADATVKAPVDGLVTRRMVDVGQETSPMAPLPLAILSGTDPMHVEGNAPEAYFGRIHPRMKAEVRFDGLPDRVFEGQIDLVGPTVDPMSKMVRVRVSVMNPFEDGDEIVRGERPIVPGMSGRIRIVPESGRYFVIPLNTVRQETPDGGLVILLVDSEDRIVRRKVMPVRKDGLRFLALEGLSEGERLVMAAPKDIEPGTIVQSSAPVSEAPDPRQAP